MLEKKKQKADGDFARADEYVFGPPDDIALAAPDETKVNHVAFAVDDIAPATPLPEARQQPQDTSLTEPSAVTPVAGPAIDAEGDSVSIPPSSPAGSTKGETIFA